MKPRSIPINGRSDVRNEDVRNENVQPLLKSA
jgi:hypothetical protein